MVITPIIIRSTSCIALLAALFLVSCSGPRVDMLDRPVTETKASRALTSSTALSADTRDVLRKENLLNLYKSDPAGAIRELSGRYQRQPIEARRFALAEICSDQADRLTAEHPTAALGHYLDVASLTEKAAVAAIGQEEESAARTLYDYSAARVARLIHAHPEIKAKSVAVPGSLRDWHLSLASGRGSVDPRGFDLVAPTTWLKTKGIKWNDITEDGFGASMVGYREATEERKAADGLMPPAGRGFPLNASFRFSGSSATFVLQDLMTSSRTKIRGRDVPLAGDFSVGLSFIYYEGRKSVNKFAALLRPGEFENTIGMFSLEPYRPDKTPLVLVHGLMSTAESWLPFVNLLLADPVVRENYQIVLFNYPTGNTIARNAADLRDALGEFQQANDPHRRNPHMREMVVLGHSMGGIISNMQIRSSGNRLYDTLFEKPLEELGLGSGKVDEIRRLAFFEANPDIDRVLFLAAPHRGSDFASNKIGQFGAWLIRFPFDLVDSVLGQIEVIDALTDVAQEVSQRPTNSVTGLRPDNPILHQVLECPVRDGVTIHSIIAQRRPRVPLAESSDGVVPYASAHLDEAVSEKIIVGANHRSMVEKDETVDEVWRILRLHAGVKPR